ncbi:MAG: urease accessory protein UreJ [Leptothrix sp. (in: Bacteria)]|nr:urease accessory protein UreJ [Leptothrix sp. (in: b-proteobacteria)]
MLINTRSRALATSALMFAASAAQAHPGHGVEGLAAGLAHPFTGLDHLLAMLAVGLWSAASARGAQRVRGPLVFLAMLLFGGLLASAGLVLPGLEGGVALSVVLLGVLMLGARRIAAPAGLLIVASAALLHGQAHGIEWNSGSPFAAYATGFLLGSAALHGAGLAAGAWLQRVQVWAWRAAATLIGGSGLAMLASRL